MAENNVEQVLLDALSRVQGDGDVAERIRELGPRSAESLAEALTGATRQMDLLRSTQEVLTDALTSNTVATVQGTSGKSVAGAVGKTALDHLGSGLTLAPLVSAIGRLFGGDKAEEPPSLVRYLAPAPVRFEAANSQFGMGPIGLPGVDYGQDGLPRAASREESGRAQAWKEAPQITVQVQAMDSRSFMDHSHEIAHAVRDAMLNMHALNDVVTDL